MTELGRRPLLKGAGAALAGLGGLASPVAAKKGGKGLRQLEDTSSLTGSFVSPGTGTFFQYPAPTTYAQGQVFDTTSADITPGGQAIHYQLQFDSNTKPYVLQHVGDGQYLSRGAVVNFDVAGQNPFNLPPGAYRATVRDDVNLYEQGGYFDWSVTRIDFFVRPRMAYAGSAMVVVWDEDGVENADPTFRNNPFTTDPPEFSADALGADVYEAIEESAHGLMNAGPSNPGGR